METVKKLRVAAREPEPGLRSSGVLVGECVDARHPTLQGRALIRWLDPSGAYRAQWLPMLMTVTVREADRVLLVTASNFGEPVIVGVLDGFEQRPLRPANGGPTLVVQNDEAVRVQARDGQELLEVAMSESGPIVKLLTSAVSFDLPGELRISAETISLRARNGEVAVSASDDVIVTGAMVRMN